MKKRFPKKKGMVRKTHLTNHALQPIAQRYICKHKYSEAVLTDATLGNYIFNLNSMYDPNRTGTGHQPYARDTMATLYNRYRVIAVSYRVTSGSSATSTQQFAVIPSSGSMPTVSNLDQVKEMPRSRTAFCSPGESKVVYGKVNLPSLAGVSSSTYKADDRYQALSTQDPTEQLYLNIFGGSSTGVLQQIAANVQLEFLVEWFDPIELGQS